MSNVLNMTWLQFNAAIMKMQDEGKVHALICREQKGKRRPMYLLRLHSRFNKLRTQREKSELLVPAGRK